MEKSCWLGVNWSGQWGYEIRSEGSVWTASGPIPSVDACAGAVSHWVIMCAVKLVGVSTAAKPTLQWHCYIDRRIQSEFGELKVLCTTEMVALLKSGLGKACTYALEQRERLEC